MKKHIIAGIFTAVFLFAGVSAYAQDFIILNDGNIIEAKVMEISSTEIKYKRFDHLDGPTIVVSAANVLSIRYENGRVEVVNAAPAAGRKNTQAGKANNSGYAMNPDKLNFGLSLNPAGLIPFVGAGPSLTLDFTKGRFNSLIDLRGPVYTWEGFQYFGISASFNGFIPSSVGGFYIGGMVGFSLGEEYWEESYYDDGDDDHYYDYGYYLTFGLGLALNIGYKFVFQSGMYFRTGANLGYSFGDWRVISSPDLSWGWCW